MSGLVLLDGAAVAAAVLAARRAVSVEPLVSAHSWPPLLLLVVVVPTALALFWVNRLYVLDEVLEGSAEYGRVVYACTLAAFGLSLVEFWGRAAGEAPHSRRLVILVWLCLVVIAGGARFAARRVVRALRRRGYLVSRALIVGLGAPGIALARRFEEGRHAGIRVIGFIDDFLAPGTPVTDGLTVLGPPSALPEIVERTHATEVIAVPTAMAWESFQDLIRTATSVNGQAIRLASGFGDVLATSVRVHQFGSVPLLTVERARITGLEALVKSVLDYGIACVSALVTLPAVALLAGALALGGVGPFRKIQVLGRGGSRFTAVLLNARPARTGVQHVIRRFGLERFPQVLNVLLGQMSIVGPRPVPVDRQAEYAPWLPNLLAVKPGLTGPWIVPGAPDSLEDEMRMDLFYIRNYTVWLDLEMTARSLRRLVTAGLAGPRYPHHERREAGGERERVTVPR